jgi:cell division protease FtsH
MNRTLKTVVFWSVITLSAFALWQTVKSGANSQGVSVISYTRFMSQVANGQVASVTITGNVAVGLEVNGSKFRVVIPPNDPTLLQALETHGVEVWFHEISDQSWPTWILNLAPLVLLAALWFFMVRQMQSRQRVGYAQRGAAPNQESGPRFGS